MLVKEMKKLNFTSNVVHNKGLDYYNKLPVVLKLSTVNDFKNQLKLFLIENPLYEVNDFLNLNFDNA